MGFFNDFADALENTAKQVGKKASEIADSSKKAVEAAAIKERLSREYEKLGRLVAENEMLSATAKISGDEYTKIFEKISELKAELDRKSTNVKKCDCGRSVSNDALYCPFCGKRMEK